MSSPVLIIAEAGVNHGGSLSDAKALIDVAAKAGADFVKFQSFRADRLVSPSAAKAAYQQRTTGITESQLEMVRRLELSVADHQALMAHAREKGIAFLSTPFDLESIALLQELGITLGKIPSGEVTNAPYLKAMAAAFPELIMSTGMCMPDEIAEALEVLVAAGGTRDRITLLHCNTEYPTPMGDVNLRAMATLRDRFAVAVGYSDHTLGIEVPVAAVALGARVIEKHFTLDRSLPGPDQAASLEPDELEAMVKAIRNIEQALGSGEKRPSASEEHNIAVARRSIHLGNAVQAGHVLTEEDLIMLRPGDGISPMRMDTVIGRSVCRPLAAGAKLLPEDLA
ncbi:MAG: N-acetylneuraminate synthase [Flavobacteriales bacterium]|nr:N-acetylneuraminate synthase [Flavobacteriales bacterium]